MLGGQLIFHQMLYKVQLFVALTFKDRHWEEQCSEKEKYKMKNVLEIVKMCYYEIGQIITGPMILHRVCNIVQCYKGLG